jgi:hypothetical protein
VGRRLNRVTGIVAEVGVSASSCLLYRLPPFRTKRGRMGHPSVMCHLERRGRNGWATGHDSTLFESRAFS